MHPQETRDSSSRPARDYKILMALFERYFRTFDDLLKHNKNCLRLKLTLRRRHP